MTAQNAASAVPDDVRLALHDASLATDAGRPVDAVTRLRDANRDSPHADLEATVETIETLLRERHGLTPTEANDFRMFTPMQVQQMVASANTTFGVFLPIVALIAIVAGGVVVANLMLLSVNERRSEIGLRKAIGARTRDVWWQFVLEATAVTTVGGLLAIGL